MSRLRRKKPLRSDPKKQRAWERRTRTRLDRTSRLRSGRIKRRNRRRREREFERCYGSEERALKIKRHRCCNCGRRPSENAHVEGGGTSRKAGWRLVADLCAWCHRLDSDSLHNLGSAERFKEVHGTDLRARAAELAEEVKP